MENWMRKSPALQSAERVEELKEQQKNERIGIEDSTRK